MKNKKAFVGGAAVALVIGLIAGAAVGYFFGSKGKSGTDVPADEMTAAQTSEADATDAAQPDVTPDQGMTGGFAYEPELVLSIGEKEIYMDEVSARVYMARDTYVAQYGEEPWELVPEELEGISVGAYAKSQVLEDMVRAAVLIEHAGDFGVQEPNEENIRGYVEASAAYLSQIGDQVAAEFGITSEALYKINYDTDYAMNVYNAVLQSLADEMSAGEAEASQENEAYEQALIDRYQALYDAWREETEIITTQTWDEIRLGTVG